MRLSDAIAEVKPWADGLAATLVEERTLDKVWVDPPMLHAIQRLVDECEQRADTADQFDVYATDLEFTQNALAQLWKMTRNLMVERSSPSSDEWRRVAEATATALKRRPQR